MSALQDRAARALGWNPADVRSLSMRSLRDLVRPVDPDLAREMSLVIQSGACATTRKRTTGTSTRETSSKFKAARRLDRETRTSEDHPGTSPPHQSALSIGREREGWRPLYWKRVLAEYKKEEPRRGDLSNAVEIDLSVAHAPDGHTPFTHVEWSDPLDVRGAERFARELVEDGGAQFAEVNARARRPMSGEVVTFTLANFERAA